MTFKKLMTGTLAVWTGLLAAGAVTIDFTDATGPVKPVNGVNNSPLRLRDKDIPEFRAAGIPFARLHDACGTYGGAHFVDIPNVFPNFDADEDEPKSYEFDHTDAYLKTIVASGTEIFYRLGATIDSYCFIKPFTSLPPKDFAKWARIAEHVIAHYTEGWANGFRWNIRYWEIWNEPETCKNQWYGGTKEQFFEFYTIAAKHLKARFPNIRIGGFGALGFYAVDEPDNHLWGTNSTALCNTTKWAADFIAHARDHQAPLDFFSWHVYIRNAARPERIRVHADYCRKLLDAAGFTAAESILDEWNVVNDVNADPDVKDWDAVKEAPAAAAVATAFAVMQNAPVDKAMYYDAYPPRKYCGLYYFPSERTTPVYEAHLAFNVLRRLGIAVKAAADEEDIAVLAAKDVGEGRAFYLVNRRLTPLTLTPVLRGGEGLYRVRTLDPQRPHLTEGASYRTGDAVTLPSESIMLFERMTL